jgi:hypothetical protein
MILLEMMPSMEFDENYGCILQSTQPFNILLIPIYWMVLFFQGKHEYLKWFNDFMCRITYFPVALVMTAVMCVSNIVLLPLVYLYHNFILLKKIFTASTCRRAGRRTVTFLQFLSVGLVLLIVSLIMDPIYFLILLYTKTDDQYQDLR